MQNGDLFYILSEYKMISMTDCSCYFILVKNTSNNKKKNNYSSLIRSLMINGLNQLYTIFGLALQFFDIQSNKFGKYSLYAGTISVLQILDRCQVRRA